MSEAPAEPKPADGTVQSAESQTDRISQNIESVVALQRREWETISPSQRRLEQVSRFFGRPLYLVAILWLVALWIIINSVATLFGYVAMDPGPYQWLQGFLTLVALLTTTVVLIAQNRQAKLEQQRSHLALQVNMLTEQKVTKIIHLLEVLREDMPMVPDRHDPQAASMQERVDTAQVVSAIRDVDLTGDPESQKSDRNEEH
jgi:uncharacterized membrane protein